MTVYDKAKYHYDGDFPRELDEFQAYVHTGFFLGWLVDRDMYSESFATNLEESIAEFKARALTGPQLYKKAAGVLAADMLNETGIAFADRHYDSYLLDYSYYVNHEDAESLYHVADTWEHYEMIREQLDDIYEDWKNADN
ncbi:DUF7832 domain-containing protein [Paenibacillus sp. CAU 1782]